MYPKNASYPPTVFLGPIYLLSDNSIVIASASVVVTTPSGQGAGGGALAHQGNGVWRYTPTQAESNNDTFHVLLYKSGCTSDGVIVATIGCDASTRVGLQSGAVDFPDEYLSESEVALLESAAAGSWYSEPTGNASNFTGAFPASVLVNAPRTGMILSGTSLARGPDASLNDEDIPYTVFKNGSPRLCALVYLNGVAITQAAISTITYTIYELSNKPDTRTAITGHTAVSLNAADVIYDTLQTDAQATRYNFKHQPVISTNPAFTVAGINYQVEYLITPVVGEVVIVRFRVDCQ